MLDRRSATQLCPYWLILNSLGREWERRKKEPKGEKNMEEEQEEEEENKEVEKEKEEKQRREGRMLTEDKTKLS